MKIIPKNPIIIVAIALIVVVAGAYLISGDDFFKPESTLREYCYNEGGPGTGISYSERGQIIKVGCTGPDESFHLDYIRLQAGYIIAVPTGTFYLRLYSVDLSSGLPDQLLTETAIDFSSLDLNYNSYDWTSLYFDEPMLLQSDMFYAVCWVYPDYFPGVGFMNLHITTVGETGLYGCGDGVVRHMGGSWEFLDCDFIFEVYGYI